jgi:preprotein translocase subunit SecA
MFEDLMRDVQHTFTERFLKVQLVYDDPRRPSAPPAAPTAAKFDPMGMAPEPSVVGAGRGVRSLTPQAPPAATAGAAGGGATAANEYANVGRNDPCRCGSGKKFKKCHGA